MVSLSLGPGKEARRDREYEGYDTATVFRSVEPEARRYFVNCTPTRPVPEFALVVLQLTIQYPQADTKRL